MAETKMEGSPKITPSGPKFKAVTKEPMTSKPKKLDNLVGPKILVSNLHVKAHNPIDKTKYSNGNKEWFIFLVSSLAFHLILWT